MNISQQTALEILGALDETVIIFSPDGEYLFVTGGGQDEDDSDLTGKNITETLSKPAAELFMSKIAETLELGDVNNFEYQISDIYMVGIEGEAKTDNTRYFRAKLIPMVLEGGPCVVWIACDITEGKLLEQNLNNNTIQDPVTGIYNRRFFFKELNHFFQRFMRGSNVYSVIMINLDHSEKLSDTYGIEVTDSMVVNFLGLIKSTLRSTDLFASTGNEDFIILLPDTPSNGAAQMAGRVRSAIAGNIFEIEGDQFKITASFGCSEVSDNDSSYDNVVNRAEIALYQAKHNGGDAVKRLNYQNWNK